MPRILLFGQTADILKYPQRQKVTQKRTMHTFISCVASVSVCFRSKVRPRNGILGFGRAKNETRAIFRAVSPRSRTETANLGKTEAPEEERRTTGDEPQGTMGRVARCLLPALLCAHIFMERETSGCEAVTEMLATQAITSPSSTRGSKIYP